MQKLVMHVEMDIGLRFLHARFFLSDLLSTWSREPYANMSET